MEYYKLGSITFEDPYGNDQTANIYINMHCEPDSPKTIMLQDDELPELIYYAPTVGKALAAIDWFYCDADEPKQ